VLNHRFTLGRPALLSAPDRIDLQGLLPDLGMQAISIYRRPAEEGSPPNTSAARLSNWFFQPVI
jgi:hypothetical protein